MIDINKKIILKLFVFSSEFPALEVPCSKFRKATKNIKNLTRTFQMIPCSIPKNYITGSTCSTTIRNDDDVFNEA